MKLHRPPLTQTARRRRRESFRLKFIQLVQEADLGAANNLKPLSKYFRTIRFGPET